MERKRAARERALTLRHRWYAGGVAAMLSGALVFAGLAPASAEVVDDTSDTTTQSSEVQQPAPDESTEQGTPEETPADPTETPADETVPDEGGTSEGSAGPSSTTPPQQLRTTGTGEAAVPTGTVTPIVVKKQTIRNSGDFILGTVFQLYTNVNSAPGVPVADAWASCEIVAGTSCTINVPLTGPGEQNRNRQFWVVETTAAPGTFPIERISTGSATQLTDSRPYPGLTPGVTGSTITMPLAGSGATTSIGTTVNALNNPGLTPRCTGLSVALVLDLSGSITQQQRTPYANGVAALADTLIGTGSTMSVFTFNTTATSNAFGIAANSPVTAGVSTALRNGILNASYLNATNWDAGLQAAADATGGNNGRFDLVIMVTDGAPNYSRTNNSNTDVRFMSVEQAVLSANAIKAEGSRIVAVGVGNAITNALGTQNLGSISGRTADSDYFVGAWAELAELLRGIAGSATCQLPIVVTKNIVDAAGGNPIAVDGWEMTTTLSDVGPGTAVLSPNGPQLTGSSALGQAAWTATFTDAAGTATVTVAETLQQGYAFHSGQCVIRSLGGQTVQVPVTDVSVTLPGVKASDRVDCTFNNQATANLTLVKNVDNNNGAGTAAATDWTLSAAGEGGFLNAPTTGTPESASTGSIPVLANTPYDLSETGPEGYSASAWTCDSGVTVTDSRITLPAGASVVCSITNTAIPATGAVTKTVVDGYPVQNADGTWTIQYELVVTNQSEVSVLTYDIADEFQFGAGISPLSATVTGPGGVTINPDFTGVAPDTEIASDVALAPAGVGNPLATHTYTVTVDAAIAAGTETGTSWECSSQSVDRAFLNQTSVTVDGLVLTAEACAQPAFPAVTKTGGTTVENPDGTWDIEYFVTVAFPNPDVAEGPDAIRYDLTDVPALPAGVELADGAQWNAEAADAQTPAPTNPQWDGVGTWTVLEGGELTPAVSLHTFRVFTTVQVVQAPVAPPEICVDTDATGILILNTGTVTSGEVLVSDDGCQVVQYDDVAIVKTALLPEGQTSVEPGDVFDYVLTVTNLGTRDATNVRVTDDDINARLAILGLTVEPGDLVWGPQPGYTVDPNNVDLTIDTLGVGAVATVTITVEFLPAAVNAPDIVGPGDEPPAPPTPIESLTNVACVTADHDSDPTNNCDAEEVPTRDFTGVLFIACISDAAQLGWSVAKSSLLTDFPIDFNWVPDAGTPTTQPPSVELTQAGGSSTWSEIIDWPGSEYTPSGIAIDYPGWRPIEAGDIVPGSNPTQYYLPGTTDIMTPQQQAEFVYNGLILDPSELDFAWREPSTVTFSVNPELVFQTAYPTALPEECAVARHTEVQIEKTASVQRAEAGGSFTYDLAVANVSDDSAADGVVVTDAIPADLRVTGVSWVGEGDAGTFPNWQSCAVTGQSAGGYGGTLECVLFGPLQPAGAGLGASTAPTITLSVLVRTGTTASVITNTAVVDYYTFGDPEDAGWDSDDATVLISALPPTGGGLALPLGILAVLAIIGGVLAVEVARRRRAGAMTTR